MNCTTIKFNLLALWWVLCASATAQIKVTPAVVHFGEIGPATNRVVDLIVRNQGREKSFLLRHTFGMEYEVLASAREVLPDSTINLRIKFKPRTKGPFTHRAELHFSSLMQPVIVTIDGTVNFISPADDTPCPDFASQPAECCETNMFLAEVVDAATGQPLHDALIHISERGQKQLQLRTGRNGQVSQFIPIGYYELKASSAGYAQSSVQTYVNKRNHYIKFALEPLATEISTPADTTDQVIESIPPVEPIIETESAEVLPEALYRPNNIVFLLDVSNSMAQYKKLDMMQQALLSLTAAVRPVDKMGLVSYADEAVVLLPSTTGTERQAIEEAVKSLKPFGGTKISKGLDMAVRMARSQFIRGGNNQIIIITDGLFQPAERARTEKLIARLAKRNLTLSIVGIKTQENAARKLNEYALSTGGTYIGVESMEQAGDALIEEVKRQSAR